MLFLSKHSTTAQALFLLATFGIGYLEGFVLKLANLACVTWTMGLLIVAIWIVYPFTAARVCLGVIVFVLGSILIVMYRKRATGGHKP